MTKAEIDKLVEKYFAQEGYTFPEDFEHRFERKSSAILYSLIRHYKPVSCLEIGASRGGATCVIQTALLKNGQPFVFVASEKEENLLRGAKENVFKKTQTTPTFVGQIEDYLHVVPKVLDFVFIDTDHDAELTHWYVKNIYPRCEKGALVAMHDWAVKEIDGKLVGKGQDGIGGTEEAQILMDLYKEGKLPLKKLYWTYEHDNTESGFWLKK